MRPLKVFAALVPAVLALALAACGTDAPVAVAPPAVPAPAAPRPVAPPPEAALPEVLAGSRALPAGPPISLAIPCQYDAFVGPFEFARSGESVTLAATHRSVGGAQVCSLNAEWVDRSGAFVSVSGVGCAEGDGATSSEPVYEYSPDNGGAAANPVYLHLHREDAEGCTATELTLARR